MDYPAASRRIEDLPSDGGKVVDTLAGAILRLFIRLGEVDASLGRHDRRLAALEHGRPQPPRPAPEAQPAAAGAGDPDGEAPLPHRGRGRPPGSKNRPKTTNGAYHDDGCHDDDHELDPERDLDQL